MGGDMTAEEIELGKNAQRRVAGLVVGIMSIKPDEDAPAVRLGLRNLETGASEQGVFVPAVSRQVLDHTVEVVSIAQDPPLVVLRVESAQSAESAESAGPTAASSEVTP
jgi:hypothetical protein